MCLPSPNTDNHTAPPLSCPRMSYEAPAYPQRFIADHMPFHGTVSNPCPNCGGLLVVDSIDADWLHCTACARDYPTQPTDYGFEPRDPRQDGRHNIHDAKGKFTRGGAS